VAVLEPARKAVAAGALIALSVLTVPEAGALTLPDPLAAVWARGDLVTRGTVICLLAMFLASWYLLLMRLKDQTLVLRAARAAEDGFWCSPNLYEAVQRLSRRSPFRVVVERGLGAAEHHDSGLVEQIAVADRITSGMQRSVDAVAKRLQSGLELVASVGATAPWVGLFGTLWGTYRVLTSAGHPELESLNSLAGPVGEALMLTGFGLAVAVPVLLVHRFVAWRNVLALASLREFALDVQAILVRGVNGNEAASAGQADPGMLGSTR
jgi:biopolymer transport protein ExbB